MVGCETFKKGEKEHCIIKFAKNISNVLSSADLRAGQGSRQKQAWAGIWQIELSVAFCIGAARRPENTKIFWWKHNMRVSVKLRGAVITVGY